MNDLLSLLSVNGTKMVVKLKIYIALMLQLINVN